MKKYDDKGNELGLIANELCDINGRIKSKVFNDFGDDISQFEGNFPRTNDWKGIIADELTLNNKILKIITGKILWSLK